MKSYKLSPRLKVITDFAKGSGIVADIGCDHGKISVYLAEKGAEVHAVDISEPSLQKARELVKVEGVEENIHFYCDDGLESVKYINLDAVIIAGMGWRMICEILNNNMERVKKVETLILQPMDSVIDLREYICSHNFTIIDEKLVWDEGRLYTVVAAKYGNSQLLSLKEKMIGPKIIDNNDVLIMDLINKELKKRKTILSGLKKAKNKNTVQIVQTEKEIKILNDELRGEI